MKKRIIVIAIIGLFLLMLPLMASAEIVDSGKYTAYNNTTYWTLDDKGVLTLSSSGSIEKGNINHDDQNNSEKVKQVIIESGTTGIGASALSYSNLESIIIPDSVYSLNTTAFVGYGGDFKNFSQLKVIYGTFGSRAHAFALSTGVRFVGSWDNSGKPQKGFVEHDGVLFYFDDNYELHDGWLEENNKRYYCLATSNINFNAYNKKFSVPLSRISKGLTVVPNEEGGEDFYFFDMQDGHLTTGFANYQGYLYYFDDDGKIHTGWLELDEKKYYCDPAITIGFNGNKYYNVPAVRNTGLTTLEIDGITNTYYFDKETGEAYTGQHEIDNKYYYFNADGERETGFITIDGSTFYFDPSYAYRISGLKLIDDYYYYFDTDGIMQTGLCSVDDQLYFFDEKGKNITGWKTVEDKKYYFNPTAATGEVKIDGYTYIFDDDGVCTGIKTFDTITVRAKETVSKEYASSLDYTTAVSFDTNIVEVTTEDKDFDGSTFSFPTIVSFTGINPGTTYVGIKASFDGTERAILVIVEEACKHPSLTKNEKAATCTETGIKAYWECSICGKLFCDQEGINEIEKPIEIPMLILGDINNDKVVDGRDVIHLMKYLAGEIDEETGEPYTIYIDNADFNKDGAVNELDLLHLMRFLAGDIPEL